MLQISLTSTTATHLSEDAHTQQAATLNQKCLFLRISFTAVQKKKGLTSYCALKDGRGIVTLLTVFIRGISLLKNE